jgi:hypothetical protein
MQTIPVHRGPVLPDARILPDSTVAAARHITEDSIKKELVLPLIYHPVLRTSREDNLLGRDFDRWENRRVVVCDHKRRRRQSGCLVNQHVRPFVITVVGNEQPGREGRCRDGILSMKSFKQLSSLQ